MEANVGMLVTGVWGVILALVCFHNARATVMPRSAHRFNRYKDLDTWAAQNRDFGFVFMGIGCLLIFIGVVDSVKYFLSGG